MVRIAVTEISDEYVIPPGKYTVIVDDVIERISKGTKTTGCPQWEVRFVVVEPVAVDGHTTQGFKLTDYITFSNEGALARMWRQKVKSLGFEVPKGGNFEADPASAKGKLCKADIDTETREKDGKKYTNSKIKYLEAIEEQIDETKVPF